MKKRYLTTAAALSSLLFSCGSDNLTGNVEGTDTGNQASLVTPAGTPVSNASVRVYTYKDSTGVWEDSLTTDENGTYSLSGLDAGRYSVWAETDSSVLFLESVSIDEDSKFADTDTMQAYKSVSVPVKIQPNHNPQTVEVQIWGTPIRHNVNEEGLLVLNKIPVGEYFTRLTSTLAGYSPTNDTLLIDSDASGTLDDTLELIYTGIPVVSGIEASYDTLNGVATIEWDATDFRDLDGYLIYRDPVGAIDLSTDPIGFTSDTRFEDKIDLWSAEKLVYRVAIRANNENEVGPVFYKDTIDYVNSEAFLDLAKIDSAIAYINREFTLEYNTPEWVGDNPSVTWNIPELDISGTGSDGKITFTTPSDKIATTALEITMIGSDDRVLRDTVSVEIKLKLEKIEGSSRIKGNLSPIVSYSNNLYVRSNEYEKSPEIWKSLDGIQWESCGALDQTFSDSVSNIAVWKDMLWMVSGKGDLFKSTDGSNWVKETSVFTTDTMLYSSIVTYQNKLYIVRESNTSGYSNSKILLYEYDTELKSLPLIADGEDPADSISLTFYESVPVVPFIIGDNLYLYAYDGPNGYPSYKISINDADATINYLPTEGDKWHSYRWNRFEVEYKNGLILKGSGNELYFVEKGSYPENINYNTVVNTLNTEAIENIYNSSSYVFNGKLMVVTDKGVYSDSPIE